MAVVAAVLAVVVTPFGVQATAMRGSNARYSCGKHRSDDFFLHPHLQALDTPATQGVEVAIKRFNFACRTQRCAPGACGLVTFARPDVNFFFLPPIYTFTIADPQSVLTLLVLIGIAAFTSHLAGRLRSRAAIGVRGAQENAAIAAFSQSLPRVSDAESTARVVCNEVSRLLDVSTLMLADRDGRVGCHSNTLNAAISRIKVHNRCPLQPLTERQLDIARCADEH